MKKTANRSIRKMALNHETIRHMSSVQLGRVAGGVLTARCTSDPCTDTCAHTLCIACTTRVTL
jgi:hypothetical protein